MKLLNINLLHLNLGLATDLGTFDGGLSYHDLKTSDMNEFMTYE